MLASPFKIHTLLRLMKALKHVRITIRDKIPPEFRPRPKWFHQTVDFLSSAIHNPTVAMSSQGYHYLPEIGFKEWKDEIFQKNEIFKAVGEGVEVLYSLTNTYLDILLIIEMNIGVSTG